MEYMKGTLTPETEEDKLFFDETVDIMSELLDKAPSKIIKSIKTKIISSPKNYMLHTLLSRLLADTNQIKKGKDVIKNAISLFPKKYMLQQQLSDIYEQTKEFDKAIEILEQLTNELPASESKTISKCYFDLYKIFSTIENKQKAINYLKMALGESKENYEALIEYTLILKQDNYYEIKEISPYFNDVVTYFEIHINYYLEGKMEKSFDDLDNELKKDLLYLLIDVWEDDVIPNGNEYLYNLSEKEKIEVFKSIKFNYDLEMQGDALDLDEFDDDIYYEPPTSDFDNVEYTIYDCINHEDAHVLSLIIPLLQEIGINNSRIGQLIDRKIEPTDYEGHLARWALDVVREVGKGCIEKKKRLKNKYFDSAINLAKNELEDDKAKRAIEEIKEAFVIVGLKSKNLKR